ncbi:transporter substrate-binding protein [Agrobacterium vitis]|uniref:transporter substrate-binding protein n=1 Tax=Agrobacterium vitis TaxID=373 RepID=UPI0012E96116|nr:transporter substrate-binding protein [Agrobacterium vitis]MVA18546.1 transporter substrate-binding protein [Agrobacterium vitis]
MTRMTVPISILFSTTGPYAALGREAVDGAMAAIAQINTDAAFAVQIEAKLADPGGNAERYGLMAEAATRDDSCKHIIGAITSWSRKEILPVVERSGALLWYAFPYEGYEASDSALYLGACPNQHLLPLFAHILPRFGRRPFIVGSNYIWGWEVSRIARELTEANGGQVVADRYMPLGSTQVDHLIAEIRQKRPDFILSNLVGQSAAAFLAAYDALRREDPAFGPEHCPVTACNLCETDLAVLEPSARIGHIATSVYFQGLESAENQEFKAGMARRHGQDRRLTTPFVSAYTAVMVLAQAIADVGSDMPEAVRHAATNRLFRTPLGPLKIDPRTQHAALRPHIALSDNDGSFTLFQSAPVPIEADPYLVRSQPKRMEDTPPAPKPQTSPSLKVIK